MIGGRDLAGHFDTLDFVFDAAAQLSGATLEELRHGKRGLQSNNFWRRAAIHVAHDVLHVPIRTIAMYMDRSRSGVAQHAFQIQHFLGRSPDDMLYRTHVAPVDALMDVIMPADPDADFLPKPLKPGTVTDDT